MLNFLTKTPRFFIFFIVLLSFNSSLALHGSKATVLLTGGTGYIGSHIAVTLLEDGYDVVLIDNLSNSETGVVAKIETVTGKKVLNFYPYDLMNEGKLREVFRENQIDAVIHLAGFKSVTQSVESPLSYYRNNLISTISLLDVMKEFGCHRLIFSSSATVYGAPQYLPIDENHPVGATNPYGRTKQMIEEILKDVAAADDNNRFVSLRYFNPAGAHKSGLIGEKPNGIPQNLMPYMLQVVEGKRPHLNVYGNDYNTVDGTAVRDFIHIMDLAQGHMDALNTMFGDVQNQQVYRVYNLGTGVGYSVMQMITALSQAWGKPILFVFEKRRPGDIAEVFANPNKAFAELGFNTTRTLVDMMVDSLAWVGHAECSVDGHRNETNLNR